MACYLRKTWNRGSPLPFIAVKRAQRARCAFSLSLTQSSHCRSVAGYWVGHLASALNPELAGDANARASIADWLLKLATGIAYLAGAVLLVLACTDAFRWQSRGFQMEFSFRIARVAVAIQLALLGLLALDHANHADRSGHKLPINLGDSRGEWHPNIRILSPGRRCPIWRPAFA
jgi:hypothetical protein